MTSHGILGLLLRHSPFDHGTMERRRDLNAAFLLREFSVTWRGSFILFKVSQPKNSGINAWVYKSQKTGAWQYRTDIRTSAGQGRKMTYGWHAVPKVSCLHMPYHHWLMFFGIRNVAPLGGILHFHLSDPSDVCVARHLATFLQVLIMLVPVQTTHVRAGGISSNFLLSHFFLFPSLAFSLA